MANSEPVEIRPMPKTIEMRTEADVRAFVKLIKDRKSTVVRSYKPFGDVVEIQCELPQDKKGSELAPERSFSLFFALTPSAAKTFRERFLKKVLGGESDKEIQSMAPWDAYREESDAASAFGLSKPLEAGNLQMFFFTKAPKSEAVKTAFTEIQESLKKKIKVQEWWPLAQQFRPTWLGPGVVAGVLALAALVIGVFIQEPLYHFGRTTASGIPNIAIAGFFLVMAVLALLRRVTITFLFLLLTEAVTIVQLILGYIFGVKAGSWDLSSALIALLSFFMLIWIPIRRADFHLYSFSEFWRRITFRS